MQQSLAVPRIVPTPDRMAGLEGIWNLDGELIRLMKETRTGVLVALDPTGQPINPMRVIARGTKIRKAS